MEGNPRSQLFKKSPSIQATGRAARFLAHLGVLPLYMTSIRRHLFFSGTVSRLIPPLACKFYRFAAYQMVFYHPLFFALGKILSEQKGWTIPSLYYNLRGFTIISSLSPRERRLGGLEEKASGFSMKWLLDKLMNIKNSSRPVPEEGDVSDAGLHG
jgi:hypothetical protein